MSITADEVNFLIRRHLQEGGFQHTAFIFGGEAMLDQTNFQNIQLPPQALISILKKGMLYMQLEKGINERAKNDDSPESIISSILDTVKHEEPIHPAKPIRPRTPQVQQKVQLPVPETTTLPQTSAMILKGHYSDVYCGAWSNDGRYLATGSADATAIIWEFENQHFLKHYILDHATQQERKQKDIATLAWNSTGTILATGCYDGSARLWTNKGELKFVLVRHTQSVFTVQFSPDSQYLLTGSSDSKIIVWNVNNGEVRQVFTHHKERALDVDWLDKSVFASCSGDCNILICQVGQQKPLFVLTGHTAEVNKIAWDPSKRMLASCSDDFTVRVWKPYDKAPHVILQGHTNHVYTIKWAPGNQKILISGALDWTIRVWDVNNNTCIFNLQKHTQPIYTLAFSPKGNYFISGGVDNVLNIWRTQDAALIASYSTAGGIFEAVWDPKGQMIAMCLSDSTVAVIPANNIPNCEE